MNRLIDAFDQLATQDAPVDMRFHKLLLLAQRVVKEDRLNALTAIFAILAPSRQNRALFDLALAKVASIEGLILPFSTDISVGDVEPSADILIHMRRLEIARFHYQTSSPEMTFIRQHAFQHLYETIKTLLHMNISDDISFDVIKKLVDTVCFGRASSLVYSQYAKKLTDLFQALLNNVGDNRVRTVYEMVINIATHIPERSALLKGLFPRLTIRELRDSIESICPLIHIHTITAPASDSLITALRHLFYRDTEKMETWCGTVELTFKTLFDTDDEERTKASLKMFDLFYDCFKTDQEHLEKLYHKNRILRFLLSSRMYTKMESETIKLLIDEFKYHQHYPIRLRCLDVVLESTIVWNKHEKVEFLKDFTLDNVMMDDSRAFQIELIRRFSNLKAPVFSTIEMDQLAGVLIDILDNVRPTYQFNISNFALRLLQVIPPSGLSEGTRLVLLECLFRELESLSSTNQKVAVAILKTYPGLKIQEKVDSLIKKLGETASYPMIHSIVHKLNLIDDGYTTRKLQLATTEFLMRHGGDMSYTTYNPGFGFFVASMSFMPKDPTLRSILPEIYKHVRVCFNEYMALTDNNVENTEEDDFDDTDTVGSVIYMQRMLWKSIANGCLFAYMIIKMHADKYGANEIATFRELLCDIMKRIRHWGCVNALRDIYSCLCCALLDGRFEFDGAANLPDTWFRNDLENIVNGCMDVSIDRIDGKYAGLAISVLVLPRLYKGRSHQKQLHYVRLLCSQLTNTLSKTCFQRDIVQNCVAVLHFAMADSILAPYMLHSESDIIRVALLRLSSTEYSFFNLKCFPSHPFSVGIRYASLNLFTSVMTRIRHSSPGACFLMLEPEVLDVLKNHLQGNHPPCSVFPILASLAQSAPVPFGEITIKEYSKWVDILWKYLSSPDWQVRVHLSRVLINITSNEHLSTILRLIQLEDMETKSFNATHGLSILVKELCSKAIQEKMGLSPTHSLVSTLLEHQCIQRIPFAAANLLDCLEMLHGCGLSISLNEEILTVSDSIIRQRILRLWILLGQFHKAGWAMDAALEFDFTEILVGMEEVVPENVKITSILKDFLRQVIKRSLQINPDAMASILRSLMVQHIADEKFLSRLLELSLSDSAQTFECRALCLKLVSKSVTRSAELGDSWFKTVEYWWRKSDNLTLRNCIIDCCCAVLAKSDDMRASVLLCNALQSPDSDLSQHAATAYSKIIGYSISAKGALVRLQRRK